MVRLKSRKAKTKETKGDRDSAKQKGKGAHRNPTVEDDTMDMEEGSDPRIMEE